ncbi:MAG: hypothetical protein IMY80_01765 [Chloroflexi bacterium]|nr:hypothetical protein [Chloroflexota bacterium]
MIKAKLLPGLVLALTACLLSACPVSETEPISPLDTPTPNPPKTSSKTPEKKTTDDTEIKPGETCSLIIPKTLDLLAIEAFPCDEIDDDYIQIHVPENLCFPSYPIQSEGYYIVQFKGPIYDAYKSQVESLGAILHSYIPKNGFVVKMNESTKDEVDDLEIVKWVGIYEPVYKISVDVKRSNVDPPAREVSMPLLTRTGIISLTIGIFNGENLADIANRIESLDGTASTIYGTSDNTLQAYIDAAKIPDIANIAGVAYIAEYRMPEISDN